MHEEGVAIGRGRIMSLAQCCATVKGGGASVQLITLAGECFMNRCISGRHPLC